MLRIILPSTDKTVIKNIKKNKDKPIIYSSYIKSLIMSETKLLIEGEVTMRKIIDKQRKQLEISDDLIVKQVYDLIDHEGIHKFLKLDPSEDTTHLIVNSIIRKIECSGSGEISYQNFKNFIQTNNKIRINSNNKSIKSQSRNLKDKENQKSFTFATDNDYSRKSCDRIYPCQSTHLQKLKPQEVEASAKTSLDSQSKSTEYRRIKTISRQPLSENKDYLNFERKSSLKGATILNNNCNQHKAESEYEEKKLNNNLSFMRLIKMHGVSQELSTSNSNVKLSLLTQNEYENSTNMLRHSINFNKQLKKNKCSDFMIKLHKIVKLERKIESERIKINKIYDFDPLLLFSYFDKYLIKKHLKTKSLVREEQTSVSFESKQFIDLCNLKSNLKKIGVKPTSHRLKQFFRKYNKTSNGKLSLHEFLDIFIPRKFDQAYFKPADELLIQKVKDCSQISEFMSMETFFKLRDFLSLHFKIDKIVERLFEEIKNLTPFDALNDFK